MPQRIFKHPLIDNGGEDKKEEKFNEKKYSISEIIVGLVSVILSVNSIFCFWFFYRLDDDFNPLGIFAFLLIVILYVIGFFVSGLLLWYSYAEKLKTKLFTLTNLLVYFGTFIFSLL
ncbi:hypothetical protein [Carboxylicivirga caseinilyticus]|uniref:hypothetical protein n=1 Tax=Carboxylicivirga caseinilyticus TaxID=3417572 RepID=UPI003D3255EA|nr:hypothetical protein [Marinilabiliaceae bacterium A049]